MVLDLSVVLLLQALGGVVSAEEMAPFLDPPALGRRVRSGPNKYEDESFVLPALLRFNGEPFVDDEGRLLYKFPALQVGNGLGPAVVFLIRSATYRNGAVYYIFH